MLLSKMIILLYNVKDEVSQATPKVDYPEAV